MATSTLCLVDPSGNTQGVGTINGSARDKRHRLSPLLSLGNSQATRAQVPVRRPNVVAVERVERHGCRESCAGPWMALRSVPLEWRWSEGTLRAAKGRMPGWPSFWLLFLGQTRKSDAPCKAQPVVRAEESAGRPNRPPKPATVTSSTSLTSDATTRRTTHASGSPRRPHTMSLSPCA